MLICLPLSTRGEGGCLGATQGKKEDKNDDLAREGKGGRENFVGGLLVHKKSAQKKGKDLGKRVF